MPTTHEVTSALLRKLKPSARNVRTHSKREIEELTDIIRHYGWTYPIVIDENGYILAGHARYEVALRLGLTRVPVIVMSGLSDAEKRAFALADNKIATKAGWDRAGLATELGELAVLLPECNLSIDITGFEPAEVDTIMGDLSDSEQDPADELANLTQAPVCCAGDLWLLDKHRLICGDAKSPTDFKKLMSADLARSVITDPPYNVRISSVQGSGKRRHREFAEASGDLTSGQYRRFLGDALALLAKHSVAGSIHYIFMDWRHIDDLSAVGKKIYSELKNLVVWAKTNAGQGTFYKSQYELVFVFKNGDAPHLNNFQLGQHGRNRSNLWTYAGVNTFRAGRLDDLSIHPTVKPVALVADAMRDCSRRGDIILDPFMGSGTTILAAERVGRRAYGLEIDPLYVDAAIRRWQSYTRRDAILKSTGETFDEVSRSRADSQAKRRPA